MKEIDRIVAMLADSAVEKRVAAAIVLGEIQAKGPGVVEGLVALLGSGIPPLERHGLDALARVGAKKAVKAIFPLLCANDAEVRAAAVRAIVSVGEDVVADVRARMAEAIPEERRGLDAVLAELGGKSAFGALLDGLVAKDPEAAKSAAREVRLHVRDAAAKDRRSYVAQVEKFLEKKATRESPAAIAAALKILGYLEEERATATLLAHAKDKKAEPAVRQEALIALRFVIKDQGASPEVVDAIVDAAEADDRTLAQAALMTLGTLPLSNRLASRLAKLARHPDGDRARFAIEQLGRLGGSSALEALVAIVRTGERRRAEVAAQALHGHAAAATPVAEALLEEKDADRAWLLRGILKGDASPKSMAPAIKKKLLAHALSALERGERGWESAFEVAREADTPAAALALRDLAQKLKKAKKVDRAETALHLLSRTEQATDDDRYALASAALARTAKDGAATPRDGDEGLVALTALARRGFDVARALKKDRALGLEELYYVGFYFAEKRDPLGEELLSEVVEKAGRTKLGKMAKNKLALTTK